MNESRKDTVAFWLFVSPWVCGFALFSGEPLIASGLLSFTNYSLFAPPSFAGLDNYSALLNDALLAKSLKATLAYTLLAVPFHLVSTLALALLLHSAVVGQALLRTLYYLPSLVSGIAVALLWSSLMDPHSGFIHTFLSSVLGLKGPLLLQNPKSVIPSIVVMDLTSLGSTTLIFLAALQVLPAELFHAAKIDGAGRLKTLFKITLPLLSPVLLFNAVMDVISSLQVFTPAYIVTKGGPEWSSYFYVYYLFRAAFFQFDMGYASAMAWILLLLTFASICLIVALTRPFVYYENKPAASNKGGRRHVV
ncbi:carbohydrate ABC transporter permease [Cohnella silvisoli]|uniref:Sugar ABC transporter permease n=1 Tax=Cohnella silvisoli TaxID=2873699 RepID=A0ABV1L1F1_9BACL|nr:sugar ABC transporter permease [Cohnella silvisoli]MCD9024938.1 sugar ABC transporter permease [Cohnella silvisoli]